MDISRQEDATSQIAQERVQPGQSGLPFQILCAVLCLACFGFAAALGIHPRGATAAELVASDDPAGLVPPLGLQGARLVSAAAGAIAVVAAAVAGRRLLHSDAAGVLAAILVALDPGMLAESRVGIPNTLVFAALATALACFLGSGPASHWSGSAALVVAAAAQPTSLLWGVPLAALALLRGHIYAAPRHLGIAAAQGLGLPAVGAVLHLLATGGQLLDPACLAPPMAGSLILALAPDLGGGIVAIRNPATWLGGLGALALMGGAALLAMARQFRVARLPGRLQLRIAGPLPPLHARVLWLLLFAVLAPTPDAWLLIAGLSLAAGVTGLSEDAPGFGVAVAFVLVAFSVVALARTWPYLAGGGGASPLGFLPWTRTFACP